MQHPSPPETAEAAPPERSTRLRGRLLAPVACWLALAAAGAPARAQGIFTGFSQIGEAIDDHGVLFGGRITQIAPVTPNLIFVASNAGGIWRTTDGGNTWSPRTDRKQSLEITALAASSSGDRVYGATFFPSRLLVSVDSGTSFDEVVIGLFQNASDKVSMIAVDPASPGTLYIVTNLGLLRTPDDGVTWENVLPAAGTGVHDVAVLSDTLNHFIVATRDGRLYRSPSGDAGSFVELPLVPPSDSQPPYVSDPVLALAPVPGFPARIFVVFVEANAAVYRSDVYGGMSEYQGRHPRKFFSHERRFAASADGTTLYHGEMCCAQNTQLNAYRNKGVNWSTVPGPYHADVEGVVTTATGPSVYLGTHGGLFRYDENATPPFKNLNGNLGNLLIYRAGASRGAANSIAAGTQDNGVIVYHGQKWKRVGGGDAGDAYLLRDDPNIGGAFESISAYQFLYINGDVAAPLLARTTPPPPTNVSFALDPANPRMVCSAPFPAGSLQCSAAGGANPWDLWSEDRGFSTVAMVDSTHAWAIGTVGRIFRTETGITGAWIDVTSNLPTGRLGIDAPENGDPARALVLAGNPLQVWETTNWGATWVMRGIPPHDDPGYPGPGPEQDPVPQSFAVTFAKFPDWPEVWYVGTTAGLLASPDGGATWYDTNVPHVQINDLDTYQDVVTVATWGRGVWQRVHQRFPIEVLLPYDFFWWMRHDPVVLPELWASQMITASGDRIQEVRLFGNGGRVFHQSDQPFGPRDFRLSPGAPFLLKGDATGQITLSGPRAGAQPLVLAPGWNAVGILDPSVISAGQLVADAAAQGIALGGVVQGSGEIAFFPSAPGIPATAGDFPLEETGAVWVFACGQGGPWTPGAAGVPGSSPLAGREDTAGSRQDAGGAAGAGCGGLSAALSRVPDDLAQRLPAEILACVPKQTVVIGGASVEVCGTHPEIDTDARHDYLACAAQPESRGCAVMIHPTDVREEATGTLTILFGIEANGTAVLPTGGLCPVDAVDPDATLNVIYDVRLDPPAVDLSVTGITGDVAPVQGGCGGATDAAVANLVAAAAIEALGTEITTRLGGLAPHCDPPFSPPDSDADGTVDCNDGCPLDPNKIGPGACGCGIVDDQDGDGFVSCGPDCDDSNAQVWAPPSEVTGLMLGIDPASGGTLLSWSPPAAPGATALRYDVLQAPAPDGFVIGECLESDDGSDTTAVLLFTPEAGACAHILVRAENGCPNGQGTLGTDSSGVARIGRDCP